jgi:hypothetical protein
MPILRAPKQDLAVALARENIQEDTRCHDADALELLLHPSGFLFDTARANSRRAAPSPPFRAHTGPLNDENHRHPS